jgi:membrane glycosyltransferase
VTDRTPSAAARAAFEPDAVAPRGLEVAPERLLQDWRQAHARAVAYAGALEIPETERAELATRAVERAVGRPDWEPGAEAIAETLRALRELLMERAPLDPALRLAGLDDFVTWRLARRAAVQADAGPASTSALPVCAGRLWSMPRLTRRPMVPDRIERRFVRRTFGRLFGGRRAPGAAEQHQSLRSERSRWPWVRSARRRRLLLAVLVLIPSIVASGFMLNVLPHQGGTWLEVAIVLFFGALFGWISIGFWTATLGFFTLVIGRRRFAITNLEPLAPTAFAPAGRTAIVMPIYEEPVDRVFAGLKAIYQSLERTGALEHFDFFILSDSADPDTCLREEEAWMQWVREVDGAQRIFHRRRRVRVRRKSGNVADFCRRWGAQYRYMIMLDADSVMAGDTLVRLVQMMERRPDAGMIQTAPTAVNRRSLFARVQQFSSRVYGPMFAAGLHFWQLGDGQYWGHNTVIRIAPFMEHCGLPKLPGEPPLGGEILSHDFVEAALMGRAGWTLWLAYDIGGSYEEVPSTLLEEMKRDRRWCQGNLQHLRLLFTEGLFGAHRALFVNGVLSYVSALLWFTFLALSTAEAIRDVLREPDYFPHGPSLFPEWPIWRPNWALALLAVTGLILFLPKLLSIALIVFKSRTARAYGGKLRLFLSVLLEILFSSLLAPIRMVFHSRFVVQNLLGRTVTWRSQGREDAETSWREAIAHHGFDTVFATAWGMSLYLLNPHYFWWVTPIIGALFLSIPFSVYASRVRLGTRARTLGLFLIPEESDPPAELRDLDANLRQAERDVTQLPHAETDRFVRVAVDPFVNATHRSLLGRPRRLRPPLLAARVDLLNRVLLGGPRELSPDERRVLLSDPALVDRLHVAVWALSDAARAAQWGRPGAAS